MSPDGVPCQNPKVLSRYGLADLTGNAKMPAQTPWHEQAPGNFTRDGHRLVWRWKEQILWVEPWGADCIRVRATVLPEMPQRDWSLLKARPASPKITVEKDNARMVNGRLTATVDAKGRVRFFRDGSDQPLVEEIFARTNYPPSRTFKSVGSDLYHAEASFTAFDDERIYGLGQRRHGLLDQKGLRARS